MKQTILELVSGHLVMYPAMQAEDAVRLVAQSVAGEGVAPPEEAELLARLREGMARPGRFTAAPAPLPLGGDWCRVFLSALYAGPNVETVVRLCLNSAATGAQGREKRLEQALDAFVALCAQGSLPWPQAVAAPLVGQVLASGLPPAHSRRFADLYGAETCLMDPFSAGMLPVFTLVDQALARKPHVLVGIDGMSASGKTRLAALLAAVYGCGVVHADHFFLRPQQRSAQRLAQPGGNIDWERLAPVARLAAGEEPFAYTPYNCATEQLGEEIALPGGRLTVLEGAYTLHPLVGAPCDVRLYLGHSAQAQRARVAARETPEQATRFFAEWIPMENRYNAEFAVRQGCDAAIDTTGLF